MKRRRQYQASYWSALKAMRKQIHELHTQMRMQTLVDDHRLKLDEEAFERRMKNKDFGVSLPGRRTFRRRRSF